MKENIQYVSRIEQRKNLITGAIAGAMLGLTLGVGFGSLWLGGAVGILVGLAIGFRLGRFSPKMRYPMYMLRRMLLAGSLALLASYGFLLLLRFGLDQGQILLASLLPIAAWIFLVVTFGKAIASLDELQRRIQTEAISIGFAGTLIACGGYGLLELTGIFPALNLGLMILLMLFMWLLGKLWTLWRYR
jgi:hypothetical protein